jgi:pimeloyl-ACP methyl ester carboxylesterase
MERIELSAGTIEYDDTGSGPVVVLVHGVHMNGSVWRDVVCDLGVDHRCVVPTLPLGAHRHPMGLGADLSPAGVARLLGEFLERLGLRGATLVGNDTGGALAQLLAAERPDLVGELVLASCDAFDNFPPGLPGRVSAMSARMPGGLALAGRSMRLHALTRLPFTWGWMAKRPIPAATIDDWFAPLRADAGVRRDLARFLRGVDRHILVDAAERLIGFDRPALVVWATEDRVMPYRHGERLAALLPHARLVGIEDSYTLIPLDRPSELARVIRQFAGQPASAA